MGGKGSCKLDEEIGQRNRSTPKEMITSMYGGTGMWAQILKVPKFDDPRRAH